MIFAASFTTLSIAAPTSSVAVAKATSSLMLTTKAGVRPIVTVIASL